MSHFFIMEWKLSSQQSRFIFPVQLTCPGWLVQHQSKCGTVPESSFNKVIKTLHFSQPSYANTTWQVKELNDLQMKIREINTITVMCLCNFNFAYSTTNSWNIMSVRLGELDTQSTNNKKGSRSDSRAELRGMFSLGCHCPLVAG